MIIDWFKNKIVFNIGLSSILCLLPMNLNASDNYIATSDLNLRSGPGKSYKSIAILEKGDTVRLLESSDDEWVTIQFHDKIGYSAKQYLRKIEIEETTGSNNENSWVQYIILLAVIIGVAEFLSAKGDRNRDKSLVIVLSLFFGTLGFQKFYLGKSHNGYLSILFCWTLIPTIIGLVDFAKLASMSDTKFNKRYNGGDRTGTKPIGTSNHLKDKKRDKHKNEIHQPLNAFLKNQSINEDSVIDINSENLDLAVEKDPYTEESELKPPYWSHTYVYSYDEIEHATQAQKKFYFYLKRKVLAGQYVDIRGNTNYAFILYFDLLSEYQNHGDIKLLDEQFKLLGDICPNTKSYTLPSLQEELKKRKDSYSIDKLKELGEPGYQFEHGYIDYNPDVYKLGYQYKDKLGLDKQEIRWLNKFYNPANVFLSIEGCCVATIMQYVTILKELDKSLKKKKTSLAKEVTYFKEKIKKNYVKRYSDWNFYNYELSYFGNEAESVVYLTMFKRIENVVRESYGHKRKVSGDFPNDDNNLAEEFERRLGVHLNKLIDEFESNLGKSDLETQIALNAQNVNRWRIEFNKLKEYFNREEINNFIEGITHLEKTNQNNPNIENIFFEASKFLAKYDRVQSLKYYAKYIYYDLKSKKFDNRELTKTVQKSLFKTNEQINDFKKIIKDLIETFDIHSTLEKIDKLYIPKRKKIELDKSAIKEVEQKHEGTVELLNEYLESEEESETVSDSSIEEDIEVTVVRSKEYQSIFISEINLDSVQEDLVKRIVTNSFEIHQDEVDKFARENGRFKNQLIDSINMACEEYLDGDVLIEEDDEHYVIEKLYYEEITK